MKKQGDDKDIHVCASCGVKYWVSGAKPWILGFRCPKCGGWNAFENKCPVVGEGEE